MQLSSENLIEAIRDGGAHARKMLSIDAPLKAADDTCSMD